MKPNTLLKGISQWLNPVTLFFLFVLLIMLLAVKTAHGQSAGQPFEWVNVYDNGSDFGSVNGVTTDGSGNVYQTGQFYGTIDFDLGAGTASKSSDGFNNDVFIQKLDANGDHQWVVTLGSTGDDRGIDITTDASGNVYVTGYFQGTVDFNPSILTSNKTSAGDDDLFIVKFNTSGSFQWVYSGGGSGADNPYDITIHNNTDIYVAAETAGGVFETSGSEVIGDAGGTDALIVKINSSGTFQWAEAFGSTGNDVGYSVATLAGGEPILAGAFEGTVDFNPSIATNNGTSNGGADAFVLYLESTGVYETLRTYGGSSDDLARSVAVDSDNDVIVSGAFDGSVNFLGSTETASGGNPDLYLLKLNRVFVSITGSYILSLDWVEPIVLQVGHTLSNFVSVDGSDRIHLAGTYWASTQRSFNQIYSAGGTSLKSNFAIQQYNMVVNDVHATGDNLYIAGFKNSTVQFDLCDNNASNSSSNIVSRSKAYLAKYSVEESALISSTTDDATINEGESIQLSITGSLNSADNWQWYTGSCGGVGSSTPVGTGTSITVSPTETTNYFVRGEGYECIVIGCSTIEVTVLPNLSDENDITSFTFDGIVGSATIDPINHTVTATALATTPSRVNSTITVSDNADGFFTSNPQFFQNGVPFDYYVRSESNLLQVWEITINWQKLSGTYSVGQTGNFETLSAAMSQITNAGIGGDVVFEVEDGYEVGELLQPVNPDPNHSITIRPQAGATNINLNQKFGGAIRILSSISNVLFDGADPSSGNIVMNINVNGFNSSGIQLGAGTHDLTFQNCRLNISEGDGVDVIGTSTSLVAGVTIKNCEFVATNTETDVIVRGIRLSTSNLDDIAIIGNKFFNQAGAPDPASFQAITGSGFIDNVMNNSIAIRASQTLGINQATNVFHNSIYIYGTGSETNSNHWAIANGTNIKNNLIDVSRTAGAGTTKHGIDANVNVADAGNNIYIFDDGLSTVEYTKNFTDQASLSTFVSTTTYIDPIFANANSGDLSLSGASLQEPDLRVTPIAEVTEDITGATRSTTSASKGAYESPNNIAKITAFTFSNQVGDALIDTDNSTVTAILQPGTSGLSSVSPTIVTSPGAAVSPASGVAQDFNSTVSYTVTAEAGNMQTWGVTIAETNLAPTDISLDNATINENSTSGSTVGTLSSTDPNTGDNHSYMLVTGEGDDDNVSFTIDGEELKTNAVFDFETKNAYSIRVQSDDNNGGTFEKELQVTVLNVPEAPTDIALDNSSLPENNAINDVVGLLSTTDPDAGEAYTYTLVSGTGGDDNASFNINGDQLRASIRFDFETKNSYSVLIKTDDGNNGSTEKQFTITVTDANDRPNDVLLSESSVEENLPVGTVVGTLTTTDQDTGDTHTYSLKPGTPDNAFFTIDGDQLKTGAVFDFESKSTYNLEIFTNDGNGGQFEQEFAITITDELSIVTDVTLSANNLDENLGSGVTIGSFSVDGIDIGSAYTFSFVAGDDDDGNDAFTISGNDLLSSDGWNHETFESTTIRVEASGLGGPFEKVFTININDVPETPTDIELDNASIGENQAVGSIVGELSTTDEDEGETYTYSLVAGTGDTDNASFEIDGAQITTLEAFDFETKESYSIRVQTDDGNGGVLAEQFTIAVINAIEAPTDISLDNMSIMENNAVGEVIGVLSTTDDDEGETHVYTLVSGIGDADNASFEIVDDELKALEVFDFEVESSYSIRVQTDDQNGNTLQKAFIVSITNESESPTDILISASSIQENNAVNDVVGTLSAIDQDAGESYTFSLVAGSGDTDNTSFNINGNELRTSEIFDFETESSYSVRVQVNDGNGGLFDKILAIAITNESEVPTDILLSSTDIDESTPVGTVVGLLSTVDDDNGETYTYTLVTGTGDTDNASFSIDGSKLSSAEIFDFETKTSYSIRLQTNDGNGGTYQEALTISINDQPPGLTGISIASNNIDEEAAVGTPVGNLFALGDELEGVSFTFTLVSGIGDTGNGSFEIVDGQLRSTVSFDFETQDEYSIRVMADDQAASTIEEVLLIDINDINEAPTDIQLSGSSIDENNLVNAVIGNFTTADEDTDDAHTFSLVAGAGDTDNGLFAIADAALQAADAFNFEAKPSYSIRVEVNDGNGGSFEKAFTIDINDINEAPTFADQSFDLPEDATDGTLVGVLSALDEDMDPLVFSDLTGASSFSLAGNGELRLILASSLDHEDDPVLVLGATVSDDGTPVLSDMATITINVTDVNEAPTDIELSSSSVDENEPIGTVVGDLTTTDQDENETLTYSFKAGNTGNASFSISNSQLLTDEVFDFETKTTYNLEIIVTDKGGLTFEKAFVINVNDIPTSISSLILSDNTVVEEEPVGTTVGTFSTTGDDLPGSLTYELISGAGDTDNASFSISGNALLTGEVFDADTKDTYNIRVRTGDGNGLSFEEQFTISILDFTKSNQTITFPAIADKTYGDDRFDLEASASSGLAVTYTITSGDDIVSLSGNRLTIEGTGEVTIRAEQTGNDTFNPASAVQRSFTVDPAEITVTAEDKQMTYGGEVPVLTVTYSGFVDNEDASELTTPSTTITTATATSNVGDFAITASGATADNYIFTYVEGTLSIVKAPLTITAKDQMMAYGADLPVFTFEYDGFVNGDNADALSSLPVASTAATSESAVGEYTIAVADAVSANYVITYVPGTLSIASALLTIKADNQMMVYGDVVPQLTYTIDGFADGDDISVLTTLPTIASVVTGQSGAGIYDIEVADAVAPNYAIEYINGTIEVTKAMLTATADDKFIVFGDALPEFTYSLSGFVNGDNETVLDQLPTAAPSGNNLSDAGSYTIEVMGGSDDNYEFSYETGQLDIAKATAQIFVEVLEFAADGQPQLPVVTTDPADLAVVITIDGGIDAPSEPGAYDVVITIDDRNYEGEVSGTLIINDVVSGIEIKEVPAVYPNPARHSFIVDKEAGLIDRLVLYELDGRIAKQAQGVNQLNVSELRAGVYLLWIHETDGNATYQKVIKQD